MWPDGCQGAEDTPLKMRNSLGSFDAKHSNVYRHSRVPEKDYGIGAHLDHAMVERT